MTGIVVQPIRFTNGVAAMRDFLTTLGLQVRLESETGSWVDLVSAGGMVALHSAETSATEARHGETRLSFETDDVDALAARLMATGVDGVTVYDEAYGRALDCRDPLGDTITINEQADDLYGYRQLVEGGAEPSSMRVVPVRFTDPTGPMGPWLETLGLRRVGAPADESYVMYAAGDGDHGYVGLHRVYSDELPIVPGVAAVHLTFATKEPLEEVAGRLEDAGHADVTVSREDFGAMLSVTDPDGREVQVRETPSSQA